MINTTVFSKSGIMTLNPDIGKNQKNLSYVKEDLYIAESNVKTIAASLDCIQGTTFPIDQNKEVTFCAISK